MAKKKHTTKSKDLATFNNVILFAFMLALIVLFKTLVNNPALEKVDLEQEANTLMDTLANEGIDISIVKSNELVEEKIEYMDDMDYNKFKDILGVKSDFCVYFEDATGNLIKINGIEPGIGSEKIHINGKPCE